jgi:hypothetical protein
MTLLEDAPAEPIVLELKVNPPASKPGKNVRKVRTPEGAAFYKLPIGSPIKAKPDLPNAPHTPSAPSVKPTKKSKGTKEGTVNSKTGAAIKVGDTVVTGKGKKGTVTLVHPESGHASLHVEGSKYKYVAFHGSTLTHHGDNAPTGAAAGGAAGTPDAPNPGKYQLDLPGSKIDYEIHPDGSATLAINGGKPTIADPQQVQADLAKYGDQFQPAQSAKPANFTAGSYSSEGGAHLEVHEDGSGTVTTPKGSKAAMTPEMVDALPKSSWSKTTAAAPSKVEPAAPPAAAEPVKMRRSKTPQGLKPGVYDSPNGATIEVHEDGSGTYTSVSGTKSKVAADIVAQGFSPDVWKPKKDTPAGEPAGPPKAPQGAYVGKDGNTVVVHKDGTATAHIKIEETGKTHTAKWSAQDAATHVASGAWKPEGEPASKPSSKDIVYEHDSGKYKLTVHPDGTGTFEDLTGNYGDHSKTEIDAGQVQANIKGTGNHWKQQRGPSTPAAKPKPADNGGPEIYTTESGVTLEVLPSGSGKWTGKNGDTKFVSKKYVASVQANKSGKWTKVTNPAAPEYGSSNVPGQPYNYISGVQPPKGYYTSAVEPQAYFTVDNNGEGMYHYVNGGTDYMSEEDVENELLSSSYVWHGTEKPAIISTPPKASPASKPLEDVLAEQITKMQDAIDKDVQKATPAGHDPHAGTSAAGYDPSKPHLKNAAGDYIQAGMTVKTAKGKSATVTDIKTSTGEVYLHVEGSKYKYVKHKPDKLTPVGQDIATPDAPPAPHAGPGIYHGGPGAPLEGAVLTVHEDGSAHLWLGGQSSGLDAANVDHYVQNMGLTKIGEQHKAPPGEYQFDVDPADPDVDSYQDTKLTVHADGSGTWTYSESDSQEATPMQVNLALASGQYHYAGYSAAQTNMTPSTPGEAAPHDVVNTPVVTSVPTGPKKTTPAMLAKAKTKPWNSAYLKPGAVIVLPNGDSATVTSVVKQPGIQANDVYVHLENPDAFPPETLEKAKKDVYGGIKCLTYVKGGGKQPIIVPDWAHKNAATLPAYQNLPGPAASNTKTPDGGVPHIDTASFTKVGGQAGSNPGGLYESANGEKFYLKAPQSLIHVENEVLAGRLYKAAGVNVPDVAMADLHGQFGPDKKVGVASKIQKFDTFQSLGSSAPYTKAHKDFAVDAWLGNYDAVGTGKDNIGVDKDGNILRIDAGGSLLFRAQGAAKGTGGTNPFGDEVLELDSLRDPSINPHAAAVFKGVKPDPSDKNFVDGVQRILAIRPEQIDSMVAETVTHKPTADKLAATLKARREFMAKKAGLELPEKAKLQQDAKEALAKVPAGGKAHPVDPAKPVHETTIDVDGKDKYFHYQDVGANSIKPGDVITFQGNPGVPYVVTKIDASPANGKPALFGKANGTGEESYLFVQQPSAGERTVSRMSEPPAGWAPPPPPPPPTPGASNAHLAKQYKSPKEPPTSHASSTIAQMNSTMTREASFKKAWALVTPEQKKALASIGITTQAQFVAKCSSLSHAWDNGCNDTSAEIGVFQKATAIEFGMKKAYVWPPTKSEPMKSQIAKMMQNHGAAYQAIARVMYQNTQNELKAKGITHLTVWRGSKHHAPDVGGGMGYHTGGSSPAPPWAWSGGIKDDVHLMPLSSFVYSSGHEWQGTKISATVPVESIFSFNKTGFGTHGEVEIILMHVDDAPLHVSNPVKPKSPTYTADQYYATYGSVGQ